MTTHEDRFAGSIALAANARAPKDSRGTPIKVGARVAYNCSGDVVEGWVIEIGRTHIKIETHPDFQQVRDDTKPSRVRNATSILVLE